MAWQGQQVSKAKTNQEVIDQTITITANIMDGIRWVLESTGGLNWRLEVSNRAGAWNQPKRPNV